MNFKKLLAQEEDRYQRRLAAAEVSRPQNEPTPWTPPTPEQLAAMLERAFGKRRRRRATRRRK